MCLATALFWLNNNNGIPDDDDGEPSCGYRTKEGSECVERKTPLEGRLRDEKQELPYLMIKSDTCRSILF